MKITVKDLDTLLENMDTTCEIGEIDSYIYGMDDEDKSLSHNIELMSEYMGENGYGYELEPIEVKENGYVIVEITESYMRRLDRDA